MRYVTLGIGILCALLAAIPPAGADTFVRQVMHSDAFTMMGKTQPATDDTITVWFSKDRTAMSGGQMNAILDIKGQKFYVLDHDARSYSAISLPIDLSAMLPADDPNAGMLKQMLEMMAGSTTVTRTDETRKIRSWNARLYKVEIASTFLSIKSDSWATEDVDIDMNVYKAMQQALFSLNPALRGAADELAKIKGLILLEEQTVTSMGTTMTSRRETIEVRTGKPPAGTYSPPAGYEEKPFDPTEAMGHGGR